MRLRRVLSVTLLLFAASGHMVEVADAIAPVGGAGYTAFRRTSDSIEFVSVDAISARRLIARGFRITETVRLSLLEPASRVPTPRTGSLDVPVLPDVEPTGVIVAVVDSGVDPAHPWLAKHLVPGHSFVGESGDWADANGHGTHVAGIVRQADPSARIMPVRAFDAFGWGSDHAAAAGIAWAVTNGATVVNLSFGGTTPSGAVEAALDFARDRNVVVVAAAGNSGQRNSPVFYPAAYDSVIAVAAVDANAVAADFSNRGAYVDVAAVGVDVVSALPGARFGVMSGTSMAAPRVSGAIAKLRSLRQDLDAASAVQHLVSTSRDVGDPGRDDVYGWGVLDQERAVAEAGAPVASVPLALSSAGPLHLLTTPRRGAVLLTAQSPVSTMRVYADGELMVDSSTITDRWRVPLFFTTELFVVARDAAGRAYEPLTLTAEPLPLPTPTVTLAHRSGSLVVTITVPSTPGVIRLEALSADGDLVAITVPRRGKKTSATILIPSKRDVLWEAYVCLEHDQFELCSDSAYSDPQHSARELALGRSPAPLPARH